MVLSPQQVQQVHFSRRIGRAKWNRDRVSQTDPALFTRPGTYDRQFDTCFISPNRLKDECIPTQSLKAHFGRETLKHLCPITDSHLGHRTVLELWSYVYEFIHSPISTFETTFFCASQMRLGRLAARLEMLTSHCFMLGGPNTQAQEQLWLTHTLCTIRL